MESLQGNPPVVLAHGLVILSYAENSGAMLSIGATLSAPARFWTLTVSVGLLLAGMVAFLLLSRDLPVSLIVALSLMIGGGLSNFYDRLVNDGRVVDFLTIGYGGLRTGVFNVADIAITAGVLLFFVDALIRRRRRA
jgi:signal peptidase II